MLHNKDSKSALVARIYGSCSFPLFFKHPAKKKVTRNYEMMWINVIYLYNLKVLIYNKYSITQIFYLFYYMFYSDKIK